MKTRKTRLSPAQQTYATAKALVDTLRAECDAEFERLGLSYADGMSEEECDRVSDAREDVEARLGYWRATTALHNAEQAMIAWADTVIQRNHPRDYHRVSVAFRNAPPTLEWHRKLVDYCFRLAA